MPPRVASTDERERTRAEPEGALAAVLAAERRAQAELEAALEEARATREAARAEARAIELRFETSLDRALAELRSALDAEYAAAAAAARRDAEVEASRYRDAAEERVVALGRRLAHRVATGEDDP